MIKKDTIMMSKYVLYNILLSKHGCQYLIIYSKNYKNINILMKQVHLNAKKNSHKIYLKIWSKNTSELQVGTQN